jgi:hypothetical protein
MTVTFLLYLLSLFSRNAFFCRHICEDVCNVSLDQHGECWSTREMYNFVSSLDCVCEIY